MTGAKTVQSHLPHALFLSLLDPCRAGRWFVTAPAGVGGRDGDAVQSDHRKDSPVALPHAFLFTPTVDFETNPKFAELQLS
jgi:hypothetical protein